MYDGLEIEIRSLGPHAVVAIGGEIDMGNAARLGACLAGVVEVGARHLELDLGGVEFIDSSGVNAINTVQRQLGDEGTLTLSCGPNVQRVLDVAGFRARR